MVPAGNVHRQVKPEAGDYGRGSYIVNAPGTEHSACSETGSVVLIQRDQPVNILEEK